VLFTDRREKSQEIAARDILVGNRDDKLGAKFWLRVRMNLGQRGTEEKGLIAE
jgi:hypothetical protein